MIVRKEGVASHLQSSLASVRLLNQVKLDHTLLLGSSSTVDRPTPVMHPADTNDTFCPWAAINDSVNCYKYPLLR